MCFLLRDRTNRYCLIVLLAIAGWPGIGMGSAVVAQPTSFLPMYDSTLVDTELGDAAWGDYDNDGDFDLVLTGRLLDAQNPVPITRIFEFIEERGVVIGQQVIEVAFFRERTSLPGLWQSTVTWGDYDNDNDLDLFIAGLQADDTPLAQIYENQGGGTLALHAELTGFHSGEATWGDYDNDSDLDLLVAGVEAGGQYRSVIYENQAGAFVQRDVGLVGVRDASAKWGDYDNDTDLDILLAGMDAQLDPVFKVYRNEGGGTFVETSDNLEGLPFLTVDWGDYDNDGDLDILHSGAKYSPFVLEGTTRIYRNEGGAFTRVDERLGVFGGDVAWGDFNGDSRLDYLAFGRVRPHESVAGIINQNVDGSFVPLEIPFPFAGVLDADWGDYDGDGDLDILVVGERGDGQAPVPVYRNDINTFNPRPDAPTGLQATVEDGVSTLSWQAPPGGEGLSYNLRVGTTPGASDVVSPMALPSGRRLLSARGNAGHNLEWTLHDLPLGLYYWSVQALNAAYHGSAFATDGLFTTGDRSDRTPPATPSGFTASAEDRQVRLSWQPNTEPDFIRYLVHRGPTPEAETILISLPAGTEMYLDTDVQNGETYYYRLQAQDAVGNLSDLTEAQAALPTSRFTEIEVAGLPGGSKGSIAWGDYDADGDPDLAYGNRFSAAIYRNDDGVLVRDRDIKPLWDFPSFDWGDYDNDGYLDLAMSGQTEDNFVSARFQWQVRVYRNNGSSGLGFDLTEGKVRWGDYDNDGDLDLLVAARSGGRFTTLFLNDDGDLRPIPFGLGRAFSGGIASGDYDNDGDPDLVLSDFSDEMDVFRNEGGTFTPVANVTSVFTHKTIWGDYDNDGDLDLLVADRNGSRLYRNDNGSFVDTQIRFPALTTPETVNAKVDVVWGDFDNNGYLDLIFAGANFTTVYRNTGDGFLQDGSVLETFEQVDLDAVDFDGDGDLDLLMSGGALDPLVSSGRVVLFRNDTITDGASRVPVHLDR